MLYMESDTRFSTSGFFHGSVAPRPPSIPLNPLQIFTKIRKFEFIAGVIDTGDKLFTGDKDRPEMNY